MNRFLKKKSRMNVWWMDADRLRNIFNFESILMRISILKIAFLFALEENSANNRIRFSYEEIKWATNLNENRILDAINWLSENGIIFEYSSESKSKLFYLNNYSYEKIFYGSSEEKWVILPNEEILKILKDSSNYSMDTFKKLKEFIRY